MISIYESKTDLLISKVVRFGTGKPIGSLWKRHNLEKWLLIQDGDKKGQMRHRREGMMKT